MNKTNTLNKHLTQLYYSIGARPTGSKNNQRATSYIVSILEDLGFTTTCQEFDCMNWVSNGATLTADTHSLPILSSDYSLACNLSAGFVCANTLEQLQSIDCTDKILVLYGDFCKEPLMPKNFTFWNPKEHQQLISLLELKNPLAILTASSIPIIEDGDFDIPCGIIPPASLSKLQNANTLHLCIDTVRKPSKAANVIATYGTGKKISLSAHIDTKPNTRGALDNTSGLATLLTLAAYIPKENCPYQVELVFFNGEDYYSNPGEVIYMNSHLSQPENYLFAANIDGVGLKNSPISYSFYECPKDVISNITNIASSFDSLEEIEAWPQGDHMLFAFAGIPTLAMTSSYIFDILETVIHTPKDDLNQIDISKLEQSVDFLLELLDKCH